MIPAAVRYHRAASIEDALEALTEPDAIPLAGGHSLLPLMKLRIARPSLLVDIGRLELAGIERRDGEVHVGALTVWDELARAGELQEPPLVAMAECAAGIGDLQVRNRGTVGGSLAHADPASDLPAVLLALGARLRLRSEGGERVVRVTDFFLGPFLTALHERELITEIGVPVPPAGSGSAYVAVEHPASGFALAGAAALVTPDGGSTIAVTGVAGAPFLLAGDGVEGALEQAEVFGDAFASGEYRRQLARVVVRRALEHARQRAEESSR